MQQTMSLRVLSMVCPPRLIPKTLAKAPYASTAPRLLRGHELQPDAYRSKQQSCRLKAMERLSKIALGFWLAVILVGGTFFSPRVSAAETAPVIKPMGMAIPSFFFSTSEARQRDACANGLAECRPSVRAKMEEEMAYSMILPWVLLGGGVLGALFYLRAQEQKKQKKRLAARRHTDSGKFRKLGQTDDEKETDARRKRQRDELAEDNF